MRYRKPFTLEQRRDATAKYNSYRRNYRLLRTRYPPINREQRDLLADYQWILRQMTSELRKSDRRVDPGILNDLANRAMFVMAEYFEAQIKGE